MKITIFSWRCIKNPKAGGNEVLFHNLAKHWVKYGNQVTMVVGGWKGCKKEETIDGIKIIRIGGQFSQYLLAPFFSNKLADVVIDVSNGFGYFTPCFSSSKNFLHINHIHFSIWKSQVGGIIGKIGYFLEKLTPLIYRNTPIITISKSSAEEIEKEFGIKPIGIVNPAFEHYKYQKYQKFKRPTLLFLNRVKKYKGLNILIEAVKGLDVDLIIAGGGDYLNELIEKTADKENIQVLGKVSEKKKIELMQRSHIFINPSKKEGFGICNIEASYFGLPVIASNITGNKDSVLNIKTGLLFNGTAKDLRKKILYLIKNKKVREKMGKEARKFANKFSWEKSSREYLKIILTSQLKDLYEESKELYKEHNLVELRKIEKNIKLKQIEIKKLK